MGRSWQIFLITVQIIIYTDKANTQQLPTFSQYTLNTFLVNPAAAGSDGYTSLNFTSKLQWLGIKGAPEMSSFSIQTRLFKRNFIGKNKSAKKKYALPLRSGKVGMGIYAYTEKAGVLEHSGLRFSYAYHVLMNKSKLSFGLSLGINQFCINKNQLLLENADDKLINGSKLYLISPDINAGMYYTRKNIFVGFSLDNLFQNQLNFGTYQGNYKSLRQYNLITGYWLYLSEYISLEPSLYLKLRQDMVSQIDASIKAIVHDNYWVGISGKTAEIVSVFAGIKYKQLYLGYAYDYYANFSNLVNCTTHELMITLKLGDNTRRYKWIERY